MVYFKMTQSLYLVMRDICIVFTMFVVCKIQTCICGYASYIHYATAAKVGRSLVCIISLYCPW